MTTIKEEDNKYFQLSPKIMEDERIHTINIPKHDTLSTKVKKSIEINSIKITLLESVNIGNGIYLK